MSIEFKQIKDCVVDSKISFIGVVTKQGDLKSGTKEGTDYSYKKFTLHDITGDIELTAWNNDIEKFVIGGKYEIINAWCKEYKGKLTLGIQYAEVRFIVKADVQATMEELPDKKNAAPKLKLGEFNDDMKGIVSAETVTMLMIRKRVIDTIEPFDKDPNQGMVWQMTEKIYDKHFKKPHGLTN